MASFCDNLLKKGGSEKLSDEAIEETLDKVWGGPFAWVGTGWAGGAHSQLLSTQVTPRVTPSRFHSSPRETS
jgi:hypothetical protein